MNSKEKIKAIKKLKKLKIEYHQKQIVSDVKAFINFNEANQSVQWASLIGKFLMKDS